MVQHLVPSDTEYSGDGNRIFCKLNSLNNANCYLYFMDIKTVYPLIVPANYHVTNHVEHSLIKHLITQIIFLHGFQL